jgi:hypothetical protein
MLFFLAKVGEAQPMQGALLSMHQLVPPFHQRVGQSA